MCGINGITTENPMLVEQMNARIKHRGPDGSRVWEGDGITLGHNRLAIIDLSDRALQPMHSEEGSHHIVFNGEIYNYRELKKELAQKYTFVTESDTEVLLVAYREWGTDMFSRLRGIFAFGIWDSHKKELILARDHMGVKPLYYTIRDGVLAFSSEIPALLPTLKERVLDDTSVSFYLGMDYVPGPRTLVSGVSKLRPGQLLRFKGGNFTTTSFLPPIPAVRSVSKEELYQTIDTAVTRQLISDRPVGAYLSGGFDSSIVVHHMVAHAAHVKTYSVDFEPVKGQEGDSTKFNVDAHLAEKTAKFYNTQHATLRISLPDVRSTIEEATKSMNEPVANATAVTQFLLSDFVRKDGTVVVLGGDGGDELFGGYTRHRIAIGAYLYQQLPQMVQSLGARIHPRSAKLSLPFGTPLHKALMIKDTTKLAPYFLKTRNTNLPIEAYVSDLYASYANPKRHPLDTFMQVDRFTWLPDECFIRSDYASMAHGVELRVPLVDTDLVACADQISPWKKTLPHEGKRIIRATYKNHLPSHIYGQPKRGWLSPAAKWFRDPVIGAFTKEVFSSGYYNGLDGLFDWENVQAHLNAHIDGNGYYLYPLWNILVLQIWARENKITL